MTYSTLPVRPKEPLPHDDECDCRDCRREIRARQRAGTQHKLFIRCDACRALVKVSRRAGGEPSLNKRRARAMARHECGEAAA